MTHKWIRTRKQRPTITYNDDKRTETETHIDHQQNTVMMMWTRNSRRFAACDIPFIAVFSILFFSSFFLFILLPKNPIVFEAYCFACDAIDEKRKLAHCFNRSVWLWVPISIAPKQRNAVCSRVALNWDRQPLLFDKKSRFRRFVSAFIQIRFVYHIIFFFFFRMQMPWFDRSTVDRNRMWRGRKRTVFVDWASLCAVHGFLFKFKFQTISQAFFCQLVCNLNTVWFPILSLHSSSGRRANGHRLEFYQFTQGQPIKPIFIFFLKFLFNGFAFDGTMALLIVDFERNAKKKVAQVFIVLFQIEPKEKEGEKTLTE